MLTRLYYLIAGIWSILGLIATYFASIHKPDQVIEKLLISLLIVPMAFIIHITLRWVITGQTFKGTV